jgi:two-component system, chemotaxis family, chemotaxis protein CheY
MQYQATTSSVLAVHESAGMRRLLNFPIKGAGYAVVQADDSIETLGRARLGSVDLLLDDIDMPRMGGPILAKGLRAPPSYRYARMLVLTAESSQDTKMHGIQAGLSGWIVKPFSPTERTATIAGVR